MTDVFLSYSRKDTDSVKELFDSLGARNREVWIDLHGIEYSSKWWDEICAGIDGADNFVLIVSQNSLESLFCHREIQYALKHNKRIIPFALNKVDQKAMLQTWQNDPELCKYEQQTHENWEAIQSIQWIDFTQIRDIEKGVDALLETVDTDPDRVKLHTRLLLRMHDWENQGQNPSGLLRGDELSQYEQWFIDSRQKETPPHPTNEQEAYIVESRRVQDELEVKRIQRERLVKRFRIASIALGLFFTLAVGATILSIIREAKTTAQVAAGNTQIAVAGKTLTPIPPTLTSVAQTVVAGSYMIESLNLSGEANSILRTQGGNAETAALLSIRVLRKIYLPSADAALIDAASRLKAIPLVIPTQGYLSCVSFSPDGKTFVVAASGDAAADSVELRDSTTGQIIWSIDGSYSTINNIAFSPDGKMIVFSDLNQTAVILDAATGEKKFVLSGHSDDVLRAAFSPDSKKVLTIGSGSDLTMRLWDVETGKQIYSAIGTWGFPEIFFLKEGQIFYASGNVYNTSDGSPNHDLRIGGGTLAISPDGSTYVSGLSSAVTLSSTSTGQVIRKFIGHTDSVKSAAFSGDGKWLVTGGIDNTSRVWEVATGKQVLVLAGSSNQSPSVDFSPDGKQVLTGNIIVRLWNIDPVEQQVTFSVPAGITVSAISPDGNTILVGEEAGNTSLWNLNTGKLILNLPKDYHDVKSVAFSPDNKLVAISLGWQPSFDGVDINLYEVSTGDLKKTISLQNSHPLVNTLAFSANGKMLLATLDDNVSRLFDIETGQLLRSFKVESQTTFISPDGKLISENFGSKWWDIATGKLIDYSNEMIGNRMVFSTDGKLIAFANANCTISVWEFSTKKLVRCINNSITEITSLAFSPDNQLLLTGSSDNSARLWNLTTGDLLRVFSGHTAAITGVGFISDGKKIVTTSMDKTVRTWFTDYNDLLTYACTFVGSDLSTEERKLYGVSDQDPTCPQFGVQTESLVPTPTPILTLIPLPVWTPIATPTLESAAP